MRNDSKPMTLRQAAPLVRDGIAVVFPGIHLPEQKGAAPHAWHKLLTEALDTDT